MSDLVLHRVMGDDADEQLLLAEVGEGEATPADVAAMLVELDGRLWWLATLAGALLDHVGRQAQRGGDETAEALATTACAATRDLEKALD